MTLPRRQFLRLAAAIGALPGLSRAVFAETFPSRRITLVVPFAPGALNDIIARLLGEGLRAPLGQPVIVENVSGADGTIGAGRVAHAAPDGYTLLVASWNTQVANGAIYALDYDMVKDFAPVVLLPDAPMALIARKDIPANDLKEFIAWLKANPDKASMGTAGVGSAPHMLSLLFAKDTDTRFGLVAYRGAGPAMQDVIAGHIDATFITIAAALPQVRSGTVKVFGITARQRMASAPEIPTMDEAGLREFYFPYWAALFAPRGTPRDVIDKLNAAVLATLRDPSMRQKLDADGFEMPPPGQETPEALAAFQKAEIDKWWPIIKAAGIKAN